VTSARLEHRSDRLLAGFLLLLLVFFAVLTTIFPPNAVISVPLGMVTVAALWPSRNRQVGRWLVGFAVAVTGWCLLFGIGGLVALKSSEPMPTTTGPPPPSEQLLATVENALDVLYRSPDAAEIAEHLSGDSGDMYLSQVVPCLVGAGSATATAQVDGVSRFEPPAELPGRVEVRVTVDGRTSSVQLDVNADGTWSTVWGGSMGLLESRGCPAT
jgi:hypothetical protein